MSELLRDASGGLESDDDDDDIFKSNFSHADAGKVKIAGGSTGLQVGLATAKLQKGTCEMINVSDLTERESKKVIF